MHNNLDVENINIGKNIEALLEYHEYVRDFFKWDTVGDYIENKLHATIGIVEELSELLDEHELDPFSNSVLDEAGDVLFYIMLHKVSTHTQEKNIEWLRGILCSVHHIDPKVNILKVAVKSLGCMKKIHFKKSQKPILTKTINENLDTIAIWLFNVGISHFNLLDVIGKNVEKLNIRHK